MARPNCYTCVHRRELPGDCHVSCAEMRANVRGNAHGIRNGWFFWPLNFDPTWLESCDRHTPELSASDGGGGERG